MLQRTFGATYVLIIVVESLHNNEESNTHRDPFCQHKQQQQQRDEDDDTYPTQHGVAVCLCSRLLLLLDNALIQLGPLSILVGGNHASNNFIGGDERAVCACVETYSDEQCGL